MKLRRKYSLIFVSLIAIVVGVVTLVVISRFRLHMINLSAVNTQSIDTILMEQLDKQVKSLTLHMAKDLVDAVYSYNMEEITLEMKNFREDKKLIFAEIYDTAGVIIFDNTKELKTLNQIARDKNVDIALRELRTTCERSGTIIIVVTPIVIGDQVIGALRLGFDIGEIDQEIKEKNAEFAALGEQETWEIITSIAMIAALLMLAGMGLAVVVARRMSQPIVNLSKLTSQIGRGDYDTRMTVASQDELGELAESFNKMIDSLRNSTVSRHYVENIFDCMMDTLIVIDDREIICKVNHLTYELLGYAEGELINQPFGLILSPDAILFPNHLKNEFESSHRLVNHELNYRTKSGRDIPMLVSISRLEKSTLEASGSNVVVARDITRLKEVEHHLRRRQFSIDHSSDGMCWLDADGQILDINEAGLRMLGYNRMDLAKLSIAEIAPMLTERSITSPDKFNRGHKEHMDVQLQRKNAPPFPAEVHINCLNFEGEHLCYIRFRDLTLAKKMEAQLILSQKLESIRLLAGGIAHDFNNILTAVLGNVSLAQMFKAVSEDDKLSTILGETRKAARRASLLTKQLLTFAKGGEPVKKDISLAVIIRESAQFLTRGTNVTCKVDLADDSLYCHADEGQIVQVIHNLLVNAQQAMPHGGEIVISAKNLPLQPDLAIPLPTGDYLKITVTDCGVGIPPDRLDKIFDPFYTTKPAGHGIGLAVVYTIVKNHGGWISVESIVDRFTTFTVYLPALPLGTIVPLQTTTIVQGRGSILMVDDDEMIRKFTTRVLTLLGYELTTVADGVSGIRIVQERMERGEPFSAVILDLTIPGGMGGVEILAEIRKIQPNIKAVVSSGYSNDSVLANYHQYGFQDVLLKPYEINQLSNVLNSLLSLPHETDTLPNEEEGSDIMNNLRWEKLGDKC